MLSGGELERSVKRKASWSRPEAGSRGVKKVKSVTGEGECERRVIERVGGWGSVNE